MICSRNLFIKYLPLKILCDKAEISKSVGDNYHLHIDVRLLPFCFICRTETGLEVV